MEAGCAESERYDSATRVALEPNKSSAVVGGVRNVFGSSGCARVGMFPSVGVWMERALTEIDGLYERAEAPSASARTRIERNMIEAVECCAARGTDRHAWRRAVAYARRTLDTGQLRVEIKCVLDMP